ncbi:hypothetical protein K432DRAFT_3988 [Lepidopterella palustris CBS 459.81]|uniref:RanBD1 domain-containing protein n=1 Tax=Lepidopterella palustris CBS 459.81 TaxID=1314670 RepID=A0A8E2JGM8_9PEZI|nr:hypothetical protein K432DRAFT_3988 [Lepidopterella palustris CBS 459.81]
MACSTQRHKSSQASADTNESPINARVMSSASLNALSATNSDTDSGERPVREKLKNTTIDSVPSDEPPTSDHPMGDAPNHAKEAMDEHSQGEYDNQSSSDSDRGRLRRKRSFEDFSGDHGADKQAEKPERHARKKSRDITHSDSDVGIRKASGESSVSRIDEQDDDEPMKSTEIPGTETEYSDGSKPNDVPSSQKMGTTRPATPPTSESMAKGDGMVISPKNKRSRDEFLQGQDKEISPVSGESNKLDDTAKANANGSSSEMAKGTTGDERKPKRHRDSDSPKPSTEEEEKKNQQTKITPGSGFANNSTTSPFAALKRDTSKPPSAALTISNSPNTSAISEKISTSAQPPQTTSSAFKSSGLAGFSSASSPFASIAGSGSKSVFGSATPGNISTSSGFGALPKSPNEAESGFASLASPGTSVFGSSATTTLGSTTSSFGGGFGSSTSGGFGSGLRGGFGGLSQGGISSFATSGGSGITGLSDKPAKAFGAAEDDEEEEGSDDDDAEERNTKPQQNDETKKDRRFFEQEVETGEEDEETLFVGRAKLYTFVTTGPEKQWKERGAGTLKLNVRREERDFQESEGRSSKKARFVMRADGSHRLVLNTPIQKNLKFGTAKGEMPTNGQMLFLGSGDGTAKVESMLLKMRVPNAEELYKRVVELQKDM